MLFLIESLRYSSDIHQSTPVLLLFCYVLCCFEHQRIISLRYYRSNDECTHSKEHWERMHRVDTSHKNSSTNCTILGRKRQVRMIFIRNCKLMTEREQVAKTRANLLLYL